MESCRVPHLKSLALTLSIAAIAPVAISQEVPQQEKVYLEADILIDDKENEQMIAEGSVVARYEGRELYADKVIYNLKTKKVRAIGNVRIIDADGTIRHSEEVEVDDKLGDGVAGDMFQPAGYQLPVLRQGDVAGEATKESPLHVHEHMQLAREQGHITERRHPPVEERLSQPGRCATLPGLVRFEDTQHGA